jgi:lysine-specific histone demethylase 1
VGTLNKVILTFEERWWADTLDTGGYYVSEIHGEYPLWVDLSDQLGAPMLVALQGAERAVTYECTDDDEAVARVLAIAGELTGLEPPDPVGTWVTAWHSDPFSSGSYSNVAVGSSPDDYAELGRTEGERLLFAGEHTAFDHYATVNGAMLSGMRVAEELGGDPSVLAGQ